MHQDIVEIEQLIYRCCHAVDQRAMEDLMGVFHADATMRITWEDHGVYTGRTAIREWFESYHEKVGASLTFLRHKVTCPLIKVEDSRAEAWSYLDVDAGDRASGRVIVTLGRYQDRFVKEDGRWWFKDKTIFVDGAYRFSP